MGNSSNDAFRCTYFLGKNCVMLVTSCMLWFQRKRYLNAKKKNAARCFLLDLVELIVVRHAR